MLVGDDLESGLEPVVFDSQSREAQQDEPGQPRGHLLMGRLMLWGIFGHSW